MKLGHVSLCLSPDFKFYAVTATMPKLNKNETLPPLEGYTQEEWSSFKPSKRNRLRFPDLAYTRKQKWRMDNAEQAAKVARNANLKLYYGITSADYDRMLTEQNGRCAICGTDQPIGNRKYFSVDHNHETGKVRGLLCNPCNKALGLLQDSATVIRKAADYLDLHSYCR